MAALPSVDRLLALGHTLVGEFGRQETTRAVRDVLGVWRTALAEPGSKAPDRATLLRQIEESLRERAVPSLRPVFNLTGTVLHTNLGRAALAEEAVEAVAAAARSASNLEYRIDEGKRGDRDEHVEDELCRITGAEAATIVNNNAAAVMLVLNSLALRREVPVSRGELIEIGGSFRMPEIMARAGCRLVEVGTTNRTHIDDYAAAIGPRTGLVMKVHTSNYVVEGFTASVPEEPLAELCHRSGIPFATDLGSGALIDLAQFGLPREPTPTKALEQGVDVVTFSGDKLLGGPQCGLIVGSKEMLAKIRRNPMKRALRCDKMTIAALAATLRLYADPDRLAARLPTLRALARPVEEIGGLADRLVPLVASALSGRADVAVTECQSQFGSGALPQQRVPSLGLAISPRTGKRSRGAALRRLAKAFRELPVPVIGRIRNDEFVLDLRCLEDEAGFAAQLARLEPKP